MRNLSRNVRTALKALRRNVLRALLTVLGIVIGVAAVITMVGLGNGSSREVSRAISSMGANNLMVLPGTAASGGISFGAGSVLTLTAEDSDALKAEATAIRYVAPIVRIRGQVIAQNKNWVPMSIYGTTPEFFSVREWTRPAEGELFSDLDVRSGAKVCVVGQTIARVLFEGRSPVGQTLRIQNVAFTVVGVLSSKGANMMGSDQDDIVVAPWTTIKFRVSSQTVGSSSSTPTTTVPATSQATSSSSLYPTTSFSFYPSEETRVRFANIDQIVAAARSSEEIPVAIGQITEILRERHRIQADQPEDFNIRDMTEMTRTLSATSQVMTRLLLAVAAISLIVGGVGIMNIMLVSVIERTREIGLRMALGATPTDVLGQFLTESVILCLSGGLIGIVFGWVCSWIISAVFKWPMESSTAAIISAILVSSGVGIVFGFYPAWKASKLDPVVALRYE